MIHILATGASPRDIRVAPTTIRLPLAIMQVPVYQENGIVVLEMAEVATHCRGREIWGLEARESGKAAL
jgi:hypothetical protein